MHFLSILGIAIALAMDAFAVAIATGVALKTVSLRQTFRLSWHFGLFQALMPLLGWYFGLAIKDFVDSYAHWIAFTLLFLVGANMIREAFVLDDDGEQKKDATKGLTLVILSVAVSIDALAIGLSMSMLQVSIIYPAIFIGIVAGFFTILGLRLGQRAARLKRISSFAEMLGGTVLWIIGIKILFEHGVLG